MPVFLPPTEPNIPPTLGRYHPGNDLLKWFPNRDEGVTVFRLQDGSFTTDQPVSDPETVVRTFYGAGRHPVTFAELDALEAAGFGVGGNGSFLFEKMELGSFTWELMSGDTLLQSGL